MNVTNEFIEYLLECNNRITDETLNRAKDCLIDYLGAAYAGAKENQQLLLSMDIHPGSSTIYGFAKQTDPLTAAFLNGYNAHTAELDDGHRFGAIHLGAVIISAVLAAAQVEYLNKIRIPMESVFRGIAVGYEASVRCGISMQPGHKKRGYHTSGTCGSIGAAVGVGILLGYDRAQMKSTISGAATSSAGFLEIQENASEMKPYNIGHAAMSGLMAATIGKSSPYPPDDILGGPRGVLRIMTDTFSEEKMLSRTDYLEIERIYVKPYAACRHCHPAIEAVLAIRNKYGILPEAIDHIDVHTYDLAVQGHDHTQIQGVQSAKLSMPYSVAAAYITQGCGLEAFSESRLQEERILSLTQKVAVYPNEAFTKLSPGKRVSEVHVFAGAREYVERVDYAKGDPENPMTSAEIRDKFIDLMKWAGKEETQAKILSVFETGAVTVGDLFNQL